MRPPLLGLWLALALLAPAAVRAQVQGCDEDATEVRGDFELTPEDRAEHVARNTPIIVRYADDVDLEDLMASLLAEQDVEPSPPCAGQLLCVLEGGGDEPRVIEGELEIEGNVARLVPSEPLAADTEHFVLVVQPDLDIVARRESSFETGERSDRDAPVLGYGASDIRVSVAELPPECEQPSGSRRVILEVPPATDDGDPESVELEVTLTSAGRLEMESVRARARNDGNPVYLSFILGAEEARSRVCVQLRAVDALGRASEREPRVCFNPSTRPVFESACGVSGGDAGARANPGGACAWLLVLAALLCVRVGCARKRPLVGLPP